MNLNKRKKIVLINPPVEDFYETRIRQEPLGLTYLAATLEHAGYSVEIIDALKTSKRVTIPVPPQMEYLKKYYPTADLNPFKLFSHYFHFGLSLDEIILLVRKAAPDVVGLTANFTPYFEIVLDLAKRIKTILPEILVVVGGHHVTACPDSALKSPAVDVAVLGEGEHTFLNLINSCFDNKARCFGNMNGIAFRENGRVVIRPPELQIQTLDDLPAPKIHPRSPMKMILTSRGCPRHCEFCTIHHVMGKRLRYRSVESVVDEIAYWHQLGITAFDFEDDNLLFNTERAKTLFQNMIKKFGENGLTLSAMNGVTAEKLDLQLMELMQRAGFEWLNIPLVSGDAAIQKQIRRNQSRENFFEVVARAKELGLKVVAYLILGLPEDTLENMIRDLLTLLQQRVLIGASVFYPPPGSPVYDFCVQKNYISENQFLHLRGSAFPVETENFSRTDLVTLFRLGRMFNYLKKLTDEHKLPPENARNWLLSQNEPVQTSNKRLTQDEIGIFLLKKMWEDKKLFGLQLSQKKGNQFRYSMIEYVQSFRVVETVLAKMNNLEISGVTSLLKTKI